jgi:hypothetical protein
MGMRGFASRALFCLLAIASAGHMLVATAEQTGLPIGSDLNDDAATNPREIFHSEAVRGRRSYLSNLGNLAGTRPAFKSVARQSST